MDIQARKFNLIEEFLRISDESLLSKFELLIKLEKQKADKKEMVPMALGTFHEMIDQSLLESKDGKVLSHDDLKKEVKTW